MMPCMTDTPSLMTVAQFAKAVNYEPNTIRQILNDNPERIRHRVSVIGRDKNGREIRRKFIYPDQVDRFLGRDVTVKDFGEAVTPEERRHRAYMMITAD